LCIKPNQKLSKQNVQKYRVSIFFKRSLHLFDKKYSKNGNIVEKVLQFKTNVFYLNIFQI